MTHRNIMVDFQSSPSLPRLYNQRIQHQPSLRNILSFDIDQKAGRSYEEERTKLPSIPSPVAASSTNRSYLSPNVSVHSNSSHKNESYIYSAVKGNYPELEEAIEVFQKLSFMREDEIMNFITSQIIGRNLLIKTPFGFKLKLYADYTASGQDLKFINDEMLKITELYANTHTEVSYTGVFMNKLLNNSEKNILKACKASPDQYFIVSGGTGSTHAIEMTQKILGTYIPPQTKINIQKGFNASITIEDIKNTMRENGQLPLVIVSSYEHHSNEITWRKQLCDVISVPLWPDGRTNMREFNNILKENRNRKIICSFSAGSNVTGLKTNLIEIASLVKNYRGHCFFDYGAVGPYLQIDLSLKTKDGRQLIDGVYISPHKFLGGPGTCGILIINKYCYNNKIEPTHGGGGTVDYVSKKDQYYTEDYNHREKSGTPGVVQIIKCGLAFQLKDKLQHIIDKREVEYNRYFFQRISDLKNIMLLGPIDPHAKVSIMSFNVLHQGPKGTRWIHPSLVVKLLNDIFGIQGRSGCSCAGPYGHHLLGIDEEISSLFKYWISKHEEIGDNIAIMAIKPGWARINLHYTLKQYELDYVLFAIEYLNAHAHKFLPVYRLEAESGSWNHISNKQEFPEFKLGEYLKQENTYAKGENSRMPLFKQQKIDALKLLESLPLSKGYEVFPEMGKLCTFYCEKYNVVDREKIAKKGEFFSKANRNDDIKNYM